MSGKVRDDLFWVLGHLKDQGDGKVQDDLLWVLGHRKDQGEW